MVSAAIQAKTIEAADTARRQPASFRDPSGFLFTRGGTLYRQIDAGYADTFRGVEATGLIRELWDAGLLIEHEDAPLDAAATEAAARVIRPRPLDFISYPYEWSFNQLKDAALLTLEVQSRCLKRGCVLKDASAYNVQFEGAKPVFIDSLSFERLNPARPWVAYYQFCKHFLAPLSLAAWQSTELINLLRIMLDGVPLPLASKLLPRRTWADPGLAAHLHLHARSLGQSEQAQGARWRLTADQHAGLTEHLARTVRNLNARRGKTAWSDYEREHSYTDGASAQKESFVREGLQRLAPRSVWDLGSNTGRFSDLAAATGARVIAWDSDESCVDAAYLRRRGRRDAPLALRVDLANPSPGLGWSHTERASFAQRGPADCALALALVHHLAISCAVPLDAIAQFFADVAGSLIIEFVPKEDAMTQRLLAAKADASSGYNEKAFLEAFARRFTLLDSRRITESGRCLYLMRKR